FSSRVRSHSGTVTVKNSLAIFHQPTIRLFHVWKFGPEKKPVMVLTRSPIHVVAVGIATSRIQVQAASAQSSRTLTQFGRWSGPQRRNSTHRLPSHLPTCGIATSRIHAQAALAHWLISCRQ